MEAANSNLSVCGNWKCPHESLLCNTVWLKRNRRRTDWLSTLSSGGICVLQCQSGWLHIRITVIIRVKILAMTILGPVIQHSSLKAGVVLNARLEGCQETDQFGFKQGKKNYKSSLELTSILLFLPVLVGLIESKWTQGLKGWSSRIITSRLYRSFLVRLRLSLSAEYSRHESPWRTTLTQVWFFSAIFFLCVWSLFRAWCEREEDMKHQERKNKICPVHLHTSSKTFLSPHLPAPSHGSFFCQLILLPHPPTPLLPPISIPSVSFFLSFYEQTGRDRETVVVLAVWHYQLINPCQQLVRPRHPNPPSLPPLGQEWRNPLTH